MRAAKQVRQISASLAQSSGRELALRLISACPSVAHVTIFHLRAHFDCAAHNSMRSLVRAWAYAALARIKDVKCADSRRARSTRFNAA